MSIYLGDTPICGGIEGNQLNNPFSLLDYKFSEYEITNASWLRSNGQYNSGTTYADVYNLLLQIYNGTVTKAGVSVKLSTETYEDTDFVLNTSDTTFRLPLKVALASGKAVAGNGMTLGLYGINSESDIHYMGTMCYQDIVYYSNNAYGQKVTPTNYSSGSLSSGRITGITTDPTKSGIETSANGLYLYFYVGAVVQDASVIAAASVLTQIAELLSCDYVVESQLPTAENNYTWYKKYKSGLIEQGGLKPKNVTTVTFPKEMANADYWYIVKGNYNNTSGGYASSQDYVTTRNTTNFVLSTGGTSASWEVKGQGA